jgi:hypothetical protein
MDVTTLSRLTEENPDIDFLDNGFRVVAKPEWIVAGEWQLSYTTLVRLVECCREYHVQKDEPWLRWPLGADTTCSSLSARFHRPIYVGSTVDVTYRVVATDEHGYDLDFEVSAASDGSPSATFTVRMAFISRSHKESGPGVLPASHP